MELSLPKSHTNDAFVVAGGTNQDRCDIEVKVIQKRKNNRSIQLNRKGYAPAIRKQRYIYQPKDLIWIEGKEREVVGTHCCGKRVLVKSDKEGKNISLAVKKIQKHFMYNSLVFKKYITRKGRNSFHD